MDMCSLVSLFSFLGLILIAAIYQLSAMLWSILLGTALVIITIFGCMPTILLVICWLGFGLAAAFSNLTTLRRRLIVAPSLRMLKEKLPTISRTEREAIDAGNTWWERELFCGRPDWQNLLSLPKPVLSAEEESFINNQVETLCKMLSDWDIVTVEHDLPKPVWDYFKQEKFLGMVIPKQYGGLGFSALAHSTVVMKIATVSFSAAVDMMVPNSLGPGELLVHYGTDAQKNYYLPRLATGIDIPCFALTGPEAGSDAGSLTDTGIVCKGMHDGREVLGIRLTWDKRYITLAPIATVLGVACRLFDPDHLLGNEENIGITLCLIPTSHPGVEIGHRHFPMHLAFMNGPTRGKDVFVPLDYIIGGQEMAGQGWRMLMECLSIGRSISLPALATACSKAAYRNAGAYARIRKQFNTPIAYFEGVEEALGHIAGTTYQLEATRIMTASAVDLGVKPSIASAIAKYHMTELSRQTVAHAMDVHGGHMIQVGPRNYLAHMHMGIPISITVEGANILTRNLIIFGQGAIRCHPYLLKEVELISAPETNIPALDETLMSHIGFLVSNKIRAFAYGLSGGLFIRATIKTREIKRYQRQLTRMSTALALFADTSLILLGGSLKKRERISARLGDIMSQLYIASAVIKYFNDNYSPTTDIDAVCWSIQQCLYKIQLAFNELIENYPVRIVGKLLGFIIFPYGPSYPAPSDKLHHKIVQNMLTDNDLRERLTKYMHISKKTDSLDYRLEQALAQVNNIDPIAKKLHIAVRDGKVPARYTGEEQLAYAVKHQILTSDEAASLGAYNRLKDEIIKVNEFSFDLKTVIA